MALISSRTHALLTAGTLVLAMLATACPGTSALGPDGRPIDRPPPRPPGNARELFERGLAAMARHDRERSWTSEACANVAQTFLDAESSRREDTGKAWLEARYDAGIAIQRCGDLERARDLFETILAKDEKAHRARVQIARFDLAQSRGKGLDKAVAELQRAVLDSQFQNVEALVELARAQMARDAGLADEEGPDDLARAKLNLRRALAVDDQSMPAANQLAIHYLISARRRAGDDSRSFSRTSSSGASQVDAQALDMALLVASQAARKDPSYAPVHNTIGVIAVEQGNLTGAARSFDRARQLDPRFYEAQMNHASVNLAFRGFEPAEDGYRAALAIEPDDYEATLGLALALRGQIDQALGGDAKLLTEVERLLEKAKKLEQSRPEAYFNQAVLVEAYGGRASAGTEPFLRARGLYEEFVKHARGKPELGADVADVVAVPTKPEAQCIGRAAAQDRACKRGRLFDIAEIVAEPNQSARDRKAADDNARSRAAADELDAP